MAAYALAQVRRFKPRVARTAARDWGTSLDRQIEFYRWLQSADGGIAGGATNSWKGRYEAAARGHARRSTAWPTTRRPSITTRRATSGSASRSGRWSASREYYYVTGDAQREDDPRQVGRLGASANTQADGGRRLRDPVDAGVVRQARARLERQDAGLGAKTRAFNSGLHVKVRTGATTSGTAAGDSCTRWRSTRRNRATRRRRSWPRSCSTGCGTSTATSKGVTNARGRARTTSASTIPCYVPAGWKGKMPNGDPIESGSTFLSIRTKLKQDPDWPKVDAYLDGRQAAGRSGITASGRRPTSRSPYATLRLAVSGRQGRPCGGSL